MITVGGPEPGHVPEPGVRHVHRRSRFTCGGTAMIAAAQLLTCFVITPSRLPRAVS